MGLLRVGHCAGGWQYTRDGQILALKELIFSVLTGGQVLLFTIFQETHSLFSYHISQFIIIPLLVGIPSFIYAPSISLQRLGKQSCAHS